YSSVCILRYALHSKSTIYRAPVYNKPWLAHDLRDAFLSNYWWFMDFKNRENRSLKSHLDIYHK
ncbi:MAG: hypothetical protein KDD48_05185, partial [Bdellovibrionales bacterium]|nr:hypothetical protein [Bdellovibrionales bacterium]